MATTFTQADEVVAPPPQSVPVFVDLPANGTVSFKVTPDESKVPAHFRLADHEFRFDTEDWYTHAAVRVSSVRLPSPVTTDIQVNNTVHAEYFQPAGKGPHPAGIVLHILGGDFLLSRTVANHLAQHGVAALFVKMPSYGPRRDPTSPRRMISRDPHETVANMTQAVLDIRRAAAWLFHFEPLVIGPLGIRLPGDDEHFADTEWFDLPGFENYWPRPRANSHFPPIPPTGRDVSPAGPFRPLASHRQDTPLRR